MKENINYVSYLTSKPLEINFIEGEYLNDILIKLEKIISPQSAILIMGDFKDINDTMISDLSIIIYSLKSITTAPIYTKVPPYLYAGAIGGMMKFGEKHGEIAGEIITKLLSGKNISDLNSIYNSLDITVFNLSLIHICSSYKYN